MLSSLVFSFTLSGQCPVDPPLGRPIPGVSQSYEDIHRDYLRSTRQGITLLEGLIEGDEKFLAEYPDVLSPERASRMRGGLEEMREELEKRRKWMGELEFWTQQRTQRPGPETDRAAMERLRRLHKELWPPPTVAPPPREKKK